MCKFLATIFNLQSNFFIEGTYNLLHNHFLSVVDVDALGAWHLVVGMPLQIVVAVCCRLRGDYGSGYARGAAVPAIGGLVRILHYAAQIGIGGTDALAGACLGERTSVDKLDLLAEEQAHAVAMGYLHVVEGDIVHVALRASVDHDAVVVLVIAVLGVVA